MQLCGGNKTVQRKLVLLYDTLWIYERNARLIVSCVEVTVLAERPRCSMSLLEDIFRPYKLTHSEPTVFENYVHDIFVDNVHIELSLWDTAGQEEFDRLRSLSYDDTHTIMLCFSVDSKESLENVESKWVGEIAENCQGVKLVLVALKCDLREKGADDDEQQAGEGEEREKKPMIDYQQGLAVARRIGALRYLECSAKRNRGVNEAFTEAARVALSVKGPSGSSHKDKCQIM
ncbi:MAG: Rho GTPase [Stictis urceolatum]|nr:Rho GTPase [Stictis urceolata]